MNFDGNFRLLGELDIAELQSRVLALSEDEWHKSAFRQRRYEVHRDTQTIGLVFDEDFRHSHPTRLPMLTQFEEPLTPVLAEIANYYEGSEQGQRLTQQFGFGYFIRATLVRLKAGGNINAHTDNNFSLVHSHRIHIPVISDPAVIFTVGSESRFLVPGEVVEINNRRMHSVINDSGKDRVHFILDFVLPGEMCCCGRLLHPDTLCSPVACQSTDQLKTACHCFPETGSPS